MWKTRQFDVVRRECRTRPPQAGHQYPTIQLIRSISYPMLQRHQHASFPSIRHHLQNNYQLLGRICPQDTIACLYDALSPTSKETGDMNTFGGDIDNDQERDDSIA